MRPELRTRKRDGRIGALSWVSRNAVVHFTGNSYYQTNIISRLFCFYFAVHGNLLKGIVYTKRYGV